MAKFRVTAEVRTKVVLEVEAEDERAAHDSVAGRDPQLLLEEDGWRSISFGDVSVRRLGHGFDRAHVKNLIARLSDEDADAVVRVAEKAYQDGLEGLESDVSLWREIKKLEGRLDLSDEVSAIHAEAHDCGRADGGHGEDEE